ARARRRARRARHRVPARLVRVGSGSAPRHSRADRQAQASRVIRLALVVALVATAHAHADDVTLPNTKAKLAVTAGWHAVPNAAVVAAYKSERGALLAVTRAQVPNAGAWRSKTRAAYVDQVERGIAEHVPGYRRLAKKVSEVHEVPT